LQVEHQIPVFQPSNLKSPEFQEALQKLNPDVQIVVAFRMLPESVWNFPRLGTFNIHASLLPNYRGAAPIHWAVINGESETGVSSFFLQHEIDTGDLILQKKCRVEPDETTGSLYTKLMHLGADLAIETLAQLESNTVQRIPQKNPHERKTCA
jgi:methionyl-tRNA formyltransferase